MKVVVYDIEVFPNFFSYSDYDINSKEVKQFYILNNNLSQFKDFISYYKTITHSIGFNNLNYDYPILHWLINQKNVTNSDIFNKSQEIIQTEFTAIPYWKEVNKQCDLYRIHHFSNKAKRTSLKDVEIAIKWPKVQDLPYHYTHIVEESQVKEILEYNLNDVMATYEFYLKTLDQIKLRKDLSREFGLHLINHDDPKLGSDIFLNILSKDMGIDKYELKQMRTYRSDIIFKEIILPCIKFNGKEFNILLDRFKSTSIIKTKNAIDEKVVYKGSLFEYGTGGIHQCIKAGIYHANAEEGILDIDVR